MSHDDYTRALSELQGTVSELTSCAIAGRRTDEVLPGLLAARQRAEELECELRRRADVLRAAVATSVRVEGAV